mmetsp:Transcript_33875/g.77411  ORF Transcript_33875/g.77411 Transcript_33875/m.77411 type:complete len:305 (-) Transcript_33875:166-1080(-)
MGLVCSTFSVLICGAGLTTAGLAAGTGKGGRVGATDSRGVAGWEACANEGVRGDGTTGDPQSMKSIIAAELVSAKVIGEASAKISSGLETTSAVKLSLRSPKELRSARLFLSSISANINSCSESGCACSVDWVSQVPLEPKEGSISSEDTPFIATRELILSRSASSASRPDRPVGVRFADEGRTSRWRTILDCATSVMWSMIRSPSWSSLPLAIKRWRATGVLVFASIRALSSSMVSSEFASSTISRSSRNRTTTCCTPCSLSTRKITVLGPTLASPRVEESSSSLQAWINRCCWADTDSLSVS